MTRLEAEVALEVIDLALTCPLRDAVVITLRTLGISDAMIADAREALVRVANETRDEPR